MTHRWKWIGAGVLSLCLMTGCAQSDPEQALRQRMSDLQASIEAKDASAVQQFLAEDFIGSGGMDRREAKATAGIIMLRHQSLGVSFGPVEIEMQPPGNAVAAFTAMTTGGSGGLLPDSFQAYDVKTSWRLTGGEWMLYHAEWTPRL